MVNVRTKFNKHVSDNEKRRKSIREKEKAKLNQSLIIKEALSNTNLHDNSNKKIVFCDDEIITSSEINNTKKNLNENGKSLLFDSSESENEDFQITEKTQFIGKEGFELLNLQSTYGNDERFKIDKRFLGDGKIFQDKIKTSNSEDAAGEKFKQLRLLENVLGTPFVEPGQEKNKKRIYEMIRYDASNKNHEIYEINTLSETLNSHSSFKKKKERKKMLKTVTEELTKPEVSNEKFYEVSNEIKFCFKEVKEGNNQFSLLQTYALNNVESNLGIENNIIKHEEGEGRQSVFTDEECHRNNDYKVTKRANREILDEPKKEERNIKAMGIWKESFFFVQDDLRMKEGLEFINKKDSAEASETAENYNEMRKKLKEILRLHLKKQMHKRDPFKNKIGGMNKKQLLNSKLKNPKMVFNKRKSFKKNPVGKA